ncbi:MAG: methyltransferase protein [Flaviaesturariibacter sp.]|nr:methyltransferase protein [Flaviaesturariibacter sp.]
MNLTEQFGAIDIYLFDQLLKGRFSNCRRVLDAGCGSGRNLVYFLQQPQLAVYGVDQDKDAIKTVQELSAKLSPTQSPDRFIVSPVEKLPFESSHFDLVICNAVLHFATDKHHFEAMLKSLWRVLQPGGFLFVRTASAIGIENHIEPLGNGRYRLPDGSDRYLVSEADLLRYTDQLGGYLFDPIKTTNVQGLRCMTTWCVQK